MTEFGKAVANAIYCVGLEGLNTSLRQKRLSSTSMMVLQSDCLRK